MTNERDPGNRQCHELGTASRHDHEYMVFDPDCDCSTVVHWNIQEGIVIQAQGGPIPCS